MKTPKQILEDQHAPPVALLALIIKNYGNECFEWDSMVLKAELNEDFDCDLTDLQSDKIQAAITVLTTDVYETHINSFETINYLFNHLQDNFDEINPLEPEQLIAGLTEAYLIRGEKFDFSPEVRVYAGQIFRDYGMHKPPTLFPTAIMEQKEGDDTEKNEALQEIFDEKLKHSEQYVKTASLK
jgi:hypothetical protein